MTYTKQQLESAIAENRRVMAEITESMRTEWEANGHTNSEKLLSLNKAWLILRDDVEALESKLTSMGLEKWDGDGLDDSTVASGLYIAPNGDVYSNRSGLFKLWCTASRLAGHVRYLNQINAR